MEMIRFIIGAVFLCIGLAIFCIEIYGVFHFKKTLNRMHAAAMGDTLGIGVAMLGLMIISGLNFTTLKMALVVIFLWFSSPVASHLLAKLEVTTNPKLKLVIAEPQDLNEEGELDRIDVAKSVAAYNERKDMAVKRAYELQNTNQDKADEMKNTILEESGDTVSLDSLTDDNQQEEV